MRSVLPLFILLVFLGSPLALAAAQKSKPRGASAAKSSADVQAVTERAQAALNAWNAMKPEAAAPFYAKEKDLVFFDIAPLQYFGWKEYAEGTKNLFAASETFVIKPNDDLKVHVSGLMAWTTETFHLVTKPRGAPEEQYDGRWTAIWEKRGKDWLIVHEHVSTPIQH